MRFFDSLFKARFARKPTAVEKQEIDAAIARTKTCTRKINETDISETYFSEWKKLESEFRLLFSYEEKKVKFTPSITENYNAIHAKKADSEKDFIDRAYERLRRELLKLSTQRGKEKKIDTFFKELEFYYSELCEDNVKYIEKLKENKDELIK